MGTAGLSLLRDASALILGALFASFVLPNEAVSGAQGLLGLFFLLPVFWFTQRRRPGAASFGGALWIVLVTLVSQGWLLSFHPAAFPLTLLVQLPWYAGVFAASSWLWRLVPRGAWAQALLWILFEFVRVQGFFAYPYGSLASTVWAWPLLYQSADLVGTSGITLLLAWTSAWTAVLVGDTARWKDSLRSLTLGALLWAAQLGYGAWKLLEPETGKTWKVALIQQAQDPWKGGDAAYEIGLDHLIGLSQTALQQHPDALVWPETAVVPSVEYHSRYHEYPPSLRLIRRLDAFLASQPAALLTGNDHREKRGDKGVDYNAVLAWNGQWTGRYEKNRLVPFTETFPFQDWLPGVYDWLRGQDTHFWEVGRGQPTLLLGDVRVGTPICYEDAFPDAALAFARQGAQALVNVTNDSWASGTASRWQHLSLAVFRSVETRLPLVRAANDGATVAVTARGVLAAQLPVGGAGVLQATVILGGSRPTLYTLWGDAPLIAAALALLAIVVLRRRVVDKGDEL